MTPMIDRLGMSCLIDTVGMDEAPIEVAYTETDRQHMRRALELAAKALGKGGTWSHTVPRV
jgi:hypothetical protein